MIPLPPAELRPYVGLLEDRYYDNPTGEPPFPEVALESYESVFDFGCGCGRLARQLLQMQARPRSYVGVDLNAKLIDWCQQALAPCDPGFRFHHQDVFHVGFNPEGRERVVPFPVADRSVSLFLAWSVFTHLLEDQAEFYLSEVARVLRPGGVLLSTWFLFDKTEFPMMQEFQNALFINEGDPTNAVIFDRAWLRRRSRELGLSFLRITPPVTRGFQWRVWMTPSRAGLPEVDFPDDLAPKGRRPPPLLPDPPPNR